MRKNKPVEKQAKDMKEEEEEEIQMCYTHTLASLALKKQAKEKETFFQQSHCQRSKGSTNLTEMGEEERGEMAIVGGEGKSPSTSNEQAL